MKRSFPWRRSLRTRLTILFAAFALVPAVIVGYAGMRNLARSLDIWENPGVTATMEAVRNVARTSVNKLVSNLSVHARRAISHPALSVGLPDGLEPLDPSTPAAVHLATLATETELDLVALYTRGDGEWHQRFLTSTDPVTLDTHDVERALQLTSLQTGEQGYLLSAFAFSTGETENALIVGYELGTEYLPHLETIASGLTYYSQLRLVHEVTRRTAILAAIAITLVAIGVAVVIGRWVARGVSRPVERLQQGMHDVALGLDARVEPRGTDELQFLSTSFNRMVAELTETRHELAKAERLAAWQEMARRIAHEIRNPLTPIQFALHRLQRRALKDESPSPTEIKESVNAILEELEGLKTLAATFSEFARLPDPEPVTVVLNDLVRSVAGLVEGQGATVELDLSPDDPRARADRKGLRRVLTNLVKNALESRAERIVMRTRTVEGSAGGHALDEDARLGPGARRSLLNEPHVVVTVEDEGPGVSRAMLDKMFMPDYTTKPDGSGLGLAIVCRIVAQHGGALIVQRLESRGVMMHVHLPTASDEPALSHTNGDGET